MVKLDTAYLAERVTEDAQGNVIEVEGKNLKHVVSDRLPYLRRSLILRLEMHTVSPGDHLADHSLEVLMFSPGKVEIARHRAVRLPEGVFKASIPIREVTLPRYGRYGVVVRVDRRELVRLPLVLVSRLPVLSQ